MKKKKSACYYDTINILIFPSLCLNLLLRKKIYFFRYNTNQFFSNLLLSFIKKFNIEKKNHLNKNSKEFLNTFTDKYNEVNNYFARNKSINYFVKNQIKKFNLDHIGKKKIETLIKNELYKYNIDQDYSSISIIRKLADKYNLKYYPSNLNTYLILKNEKFKISLLLIIVNYIYKIFNFIKRLNFKFTLYKSSKPLSNEKKLVTDIGFCPHKGFTYGNFFKKNYIFNTNNSKFFEKNSVLNIFFENIDTKTKRYLSFYKLNYLVYNFKLFEIMKVIFFNFFYLIKLFLNSITKPALSLFLTILSFKIILYCSNTKRKFKLNKIFFHYDVLVSPYFLFSCHINSIQTYSIQDRYMQYLYFKFYFFDNYFVINSFFTKELLNSGYIASNFIENGPPRAKYGQYLLEKYKFLNIKNLNKYNINFVFLGLLNNSDDILGLFGEDGTSTKSNLEFLNIIYELSFLYPNIGIHVSYKYFDLLNQLEFKNIFKKIEKRDNIFINNGLNKINTYVLCQKSDLIIAKYTSIVDEMLSIGKKVLIYDSENYISSFNYYLSKKSININTKEELFKFIANYKQLDFNQYRKFYNVKYNYEEYYNNLKNIVKNG